LTVIIYLVASLLCLFCAVSAQQIFQASNTRLHAFIWLGLAGVMLFLGINKQLDLQSWFTAVIKAIAWEQGWYSSGQRAQVYFLAGFGLVGLTTLVGISWLVRHQWRHYVLLILGFLFILRFIFVRIGTFYGITLPELSNYTGGVRVNGLLEMVGATVIGASALINLRYRFAPTTAVTHS
jgi:hypothetical protein